MPKSRRLNKSDKKITREITLDAVHPECLKKLTKITHIKDSVGTSLKNKKNYSGINLTDKAVLKMRFLSAIIELDSK